MKNKQDEPKPQPNQSPNDAEGVAQVAEWRAGIERDHTAMLFIKQALFLEQINALTNDEFEHVVKKAKILANDTLAKDTTPAMDSIQRFGRPVTQGKLAAEMTVRNIVNVAGKLRRIRASARGGC